jgi:hypothetical protein
LVKKKIVPPPKSLKKVLHISNEKSKEQEAQPNYGHGKKDFPNKEAWSLISSKCTDLLHRSYTENLSKKEEKNIYTEHNVSKEYI